LLPVSHNKQTKKEEAESNNNNGEEESDMSQGGDDNRGLAGWLRFDKWLGSLQHWRTGLAALAMGFSNVVSSENSIGAVVENKKITTITRLLTKASVTSP